MDERPPYHAADAHPLSRVLRDASIAAAAWIAWVLVGGVLWLAAVWPLGSIVGSGVGAVVARYAGWFLRAAIMSAVVFITWRWDGVNRWVVRFGLAFGAVDAGTAVAALLRGEAVGSAIAFGPRDADPVSQLVGALLWIAFVVLGAVWSARQRAADDREAGAL